MRPQHQVPHEEATVGQELRQLAKLAAPFALAQAGQSMMGLVDTAVVGRLNAASLAAVSVGNSIFFTVSILGIGLLFGLDPLISQAVGAEVKGRARLLLWQGVWLALAGSVVLAIPIALSPWTLHLFSITGDVASDARAYVLWRIPGLFSLLLFFAQRSYLQSLGHAAVLVWTTVLANVFNLLADLLFVFGGGSLPSWTLLQGVPALGAAGAAIATSLCATFQIVLLAWAIRRIPPGLEVIHRAPFFPDLRKAAKIGIPVGLHLAAEVGVFALAGLFAGKLGKVSLAAHQIALMLGSVSFTVAVGIGSAGSVRVGWAMGAGRQKAARRSGLIAFGAGVGFMSISALVFLLAPHLLARGFTDEANVIATAIPLIGICAVFQISDGIQGVGAGVLRGLGDSHVTFIANVVGHYAIGLPLALYLAFGRHWGVRGLWWGLSAGLTAVALALFVRFWRLSARPIASLVPHSA
jgi:MATE family multidrug resistance protein